MIRSFTINKQNWCACGDVLWLHFHLFRERKRSKWSHIKQNIHLSCYFIIVVSLFSLVFCFLHVSIQTLWLLFLLDHQAMYFHLCGFFTVVNLLLHEHVSSSRASDVESCHVAWWCERDPKCRCRFFSTAEGHEEEDEWGRWAVHLTFGRFRWKSENAAFINKPGGVIPRVSWKNVKWFPVMVLLVHSTYFTYFISSIEPIHYIDLISYTQLTVCSVKLSGS